MISYSVISEKSLTFSRYLAILAAIAAPASTAVTSVACIALLITWLISGQAWQSLKISAQQPAGKMLLLFFAWLIIGCLYADVSWAEKITTLSSWKKLFYTFILFGIFYQTEWKMRFVYSYLAAMTVAVVCSCFLWILQIDLRGWGAGIVMTNYSSQSLAFLAAILCSLFLLNESKKTLMRDEKVSEATMASLFKSWQPFCSAKPIYRYLLLGIIALFLGNIFFVSASRSGYLALPVAAVFTFVNLYGYKKIPYILGATIVALVLVISTSSTLQQRIKLGLEEKTNYQTSKEVTSIGVRMIFAQNTWELIQQKPLLGYGTASFKTVYSSHSAQKYQDWRGESASDPHNQYLFVWLENGLIGLFIFLAYIYTAVKQGARQQPYGAIAAGVLIAIATTSLFNSNFKTFPEGHLLAFFVGCLLAQSRNREEEKSA